jgi:membrane fusion protein (multidrug efflux system)
MEEKKIVIRLPSFTLKSFFNRQTLCAALILGLFSWGLYWKQMIRPYLWVEGAQVHLYSLTIPAELKGRIGKELFEEGDAVEKGLTLVSFDAENLGEKQEQLQTLVQSYQEQTQLEKMRMDQTMQEYLVASNELDMGLGSAEVLQAQLHLFEEAQLKSESVQQEMARCQKEIEALQNRIDQRGIKAPFSGRIVKQLKKAGEKVEIGESILVLSDPSRVWIEAVVPETALSRLQKGTPVRIQIRAYPHREWSGEVSWIGPQALPKSSPQETALIPVRVTFQNLEIPLVDGLSAQVAFKIH